MSHLPVSGRRGPRTAEINAGTACAAATDSGGGRLAAIVAILCALAGAANPALARQAGTGSDPARPAAARSAVGTIEGFAYAALTGAPLAEVTIAIRGTGRVAVTDPRGAFRISSVPAGTYTLRAERLGIEPLERAIVVESGSTTSLDLRLTELPLELGDIVISVDREARRRAETAATINVVADQAIRSTHAAHPSDLLARVPGAWVNTTGGEGHMTAIRHPQTTAPVYLYLEDGIPTRSTGFFNHNALYELNLPQAGRIEVIKGPATALYGSDAIGATIDVGTRAPTSVPTFEGSLEAGAHGWGRLLLSASGTPGRNGLRADLNLTRSSGWRDATAYDRQAGTLRWDRPLGAATSLKTVATFSLIDQHTAGSSALARADYLERPTLNYTPISFRNVRALRLSTELRRVAPRSLFTLTAFARDNEMEILPNWSLAYDPTTYITGHRSLGLMARYRVDLAPRSARLVAGVDLDRSPGRHSERIVVPDREGRIFTDYVLGATIYDYQVTFLGVSPYLQAELSPTSRLHLTAGLRYDDLGYDYTTHLAPLDSGRHRRPADGTLRYRHLSPKFGATYEAVPALNLFLSYAHGFRAPSEGQLFRQGQAENTLALRPVRVDSYEAGLRGRIGTALRYELSAYRLDKHDDILTYTRPDGSTETVNAGHTRHRGIEAGLAFALPYGLQLDAGYAYARHTYQRWRPRADADFGGHEMEQAPRHVASAILSISPRGPDRGTVALETRWIGTYWMDPRNTTRYDGHALVALRGEIPIYGGLDIFARASNLLDRRYAELATYTAARGEELAPGMPRALYLGIQYR